MSSKRMMQFVAYDPEKLIESVKKRPGLWYFQDKDYKNSVKKTQLWVEVVHELLNPGKKISKAEIYELVFLLQKKFKGLKDCYHRYVKDSRSAKRPYIYCNQLQFLLQNYDTSLLDPSVTEQADTSEPPYRKIMRKSRVKILMNNVDEEDDTGNNEYDSNKIKMRQSSEELDDNEQDVEALDSLSDDDYEPPSKITKQATAPMTESFAFANVDSSSLEEDPEKMFLLSMLPHLRAIPEKSRLKVKVKLMEVLISAGNSSSN